MGISLRTIRRVLSQNSFTSSFTRCSRSGQSSTPPTSILSRYISSSTGQRCLSLMLSNRCYTGSASSSCTPNLRQIHISVRTSPPLGGALHRIAVTPTDTVDSLKTAMIRHSSLPMGDYLIEFGEKLLDDESDLSSCGITEGDVLSIFKGESYLIEVQLSEPQSLVLRADVTETVGSLKTKIKEELALTGTFLKTVNLYYKRELLYGDERRILGYAIPSIMGYTIPKQPRKRVNIVLGEECFSDDDEDQECVSHEIQPDTAISSLARFSPKMHIVVFIEVPRRGKRNALYVTPKDTINDLLSMSGYPCSGMNLISGSKKKKLLLKPDGGGGSCTLEDCGIKDQDLILIVKAGSLLINIIIPGQDNITCGGTMTCMEHFTKYVECFDTIGMVKSKIQDTTGIHPVFQRLKYNGWWMEDDTNRLADYGIFDPEASYTLSVFPLLSPSGEGAWNTHDWTPDPPNNIRAEETNGTKFGKEGGGQTSNPQRSHQVPCPSPMSYGATGVN